MLASYDDISTISDTAKEFLTTMGADQLHDYKPNMAYVFSGLVGKTKGKDELSDDDGTKIKVTYDLTKQVSETITIGCERCPSGTRPSRDNKSCVSSYCGVSQFFRQDLFCPQCDWCPAGYITDPDGISCVLRPPPRCGPFEKPTPDNMGCMPRCSSMEVWEGGRCLMRCGANEVRADDGRNCRLKCEDGFMNTPDGRGCMAVVHDKADIVCGRGYIKHYGGDCHKIECRGTSVLTEAGLGCMAWSMFMSWYSYFQYCNDRQYLLPGGTGCEYCPEYQRRFRSDPWMCQTMRCGSRQKLMPNGLCQQCPHYMESRGFYCIQVICKANEFLRIDGQCEICPPRMQPTPDRKGCMPVTCKGNEFLTFYGQCHQCPEYTMVTGDRHNCRMPYCKKQEIFLPDGSCRSCPEYTKPTHHGFYCRADHCTNYEELQKDGSCLSSRCPPNHVKWHPSDDHCHSCPEYTRPNMARTECIKDICAFNQVKTLTGHCVSCKPYMHASKDQRSCQKTKCAEGQIVALNGSCLTCPEGMEPVHDGRHCGSSNTGSISSGASWSGFSTSTEHGASFMQT